MDECSDTRGSWESVGPGPNPPAIDNATVVTQPQKQLSYQDQTNKQKVANTIDIEYYLNCLNGKDHGTWYYSFASPSKMKVGV